MQLQLEHLLVNLCRIVTPQTQKTNTKTLTHTATRAALKQCTVRKFVSKRSETGVNVTNRREASEREGGRAEVSENKQREEMREWVQNIDVFFACVN